MHPARPIAGQRRLTVRGVDVATTEPEIVEGSAARGDGPGELSVELPCVPTIPLVRCTEIVAWASECAYLASA